MRVNNLFSGAVMFVLLFGAAPALAQTVDSGHTAWISTAWVLVLCMTVPGLALFYAGMVRSSSVVTLFAQCFAIACLVSVLWLVLGYSLAFGNSLGVVGDLSKVFYAGVGEDSLWGLIPETSFASFQLSFAIITPALILGAFAERARLPAVLVFMCLWSLVVYAPVAHWVWGGGWLGDLGLMDFAGGTVVHVLAGASALVVVHLLGPRQGFPAELPPPHNLTYTMIGAGLLWVGWSGFNGGSALAAGGDAAMAISATHFAGAAGALSWMFLEWKREGKFTALGLATGLIGGLASATAGSGFIGPAGGLAVGVIGGSACYFGAQLVKNRWNTDDSLDVFAVHFVGGAVGTLLTAVFASNALGVFSGQLEINVFGRLLVQLIGVVVTALYAGGVTWLLFKLVDGWIGCRVSPEVEEAGLDGATLDEAGYRFGSSDVNFG